MGVFKSKRPIGMPGGAQMPVNTASTGTVLTVPGCHELALTTGTAAYQLDGPGRKGDMVYLTAITASSGNKTCTVIPDATGITFQGSSGQAFRKLTFNAGNESVLLLALSTAKYQVLVNTNAVAIATT